MRPSCGHLPLLLSPVQGHGISSRHGDARGDQYGQRKDGPADPICAKDKEIVVPYPPHRDAWAPKVDFGKPGADKKAIGDRHRGPTAPFEPRHGKSDHTGCVNGEVHEFEREADRVAPVRSLSHMVGVMDDDHADHHAICGNQSSRALVSNPALLRLMRCSILPSQDDVSPDASREEWHPCRAGRRRAEHSRHLPSQWHACILRSDAEISARWQCLTNITAGKLEFIPHPWLQPEAEAGDACEFARAQKRSG